MSPSPPSPSSPSSTFSPANQATTGDNNDKDNNLQIFLGGSCNPTTWRRNVAIPYLELNGISYYNPQVDNWTPEAVDSERYAKQNAQILLFVIDKQTRSTVSLVESAFIAGENKNLVLVIYPFEYNVISLTDTCKQTSNIIETTSKLMRTSQTRISNNQNRNESSSASFLQSSSSTTTSSTLISASTTNESRLTSTMATRASSTRTNLTSAISSKIGSRECDQIDEKSLNASHEEATQSSTTIRINDEVISMGEFQELKQARYILQNLLIIQDIPMFSDILQALKYVSCSLGMKSGSSGANESLRKDSRKSSSSSTDGGHLPSPLFDRLLDHVQQPSTQLQQLEGILPEKSAHLDKHREMAEGGTLLRDVYVSLDNDDHLNIESTIIPILKEKGLTYYHMSVNNMIKSSYASCKPVIKPKLFIDSQKSTTTTTTANKASTIVTNEELLGYSSGGVFDTKRSEGTKLAIEKEICAIRSSRVLLFVVTNKCRGLSIMVLASHFMALFRNNVVLCVQYLEEPCSIDGETLTKAAIADYNRGRVYLCDYATKSQVPVFSTIQEAIDCCSRKCGYNKN